MEVLRLILNIVSSVIIFLFGIGMITVGIYEIKNDVNPKWLSIIAIIDGILGIGMIILPWFW